MNLFENLHKYKESYNDDDYNWPIQIFDIKCVRFNDDAKKKWTRIAKKHNISVYIFNDSSYKTMDATINIKAKTFKNLYDFVTDKNIDFYSVCKSSPITTDDRKIAIMGDMARKEGFTDEDFNLVLTGYNNNHYDYVMQDDGSFKLDENLKEGSIRDNTSYNYMVSLDSCYTSDENWAELVSKINRACKNNVDLKGNFIDDYNSFITFASNKLIDFLKAIDIAYDMERCHWHYEVGLETDDVINMHDAFIDHEGNEEQFNKIFKKYFKYNTYNEFLKDEDKDRDWNA